MNGVTENKVQLGLRGLIGGAAVVSSLTTANLFAGVENWTSVWLALGVGVLWSLLPVRFLHWFAGVALAAMVLLAGIGLLVTESFLPALLAVTAALFGWHFSALACVATGADTQNTGRTVGVDLLWLGGIAATSVSVAMLIRRVPLQLPFGGGIGLGLLLIGALALLVRRVVRTSGGDHEIKTP